MEYDDGTYFEKIINSKDQKLIVKILRDPFIMGYLLIQFLLKKKEFSFKCEQASWVWMDVDLMEFITYTRSHTYTQNNYRMEEITTPAEYWFDYIIVINYLESCSLAMCKIVSIITRIDTWTY